MTLYVVGTPIGNLRDISERALETLRSVELIAAEDTRVTKKLLNHYGIKARIISYREQVHEKTTRIISERLERGDSVALVTDAGTPTISDPGARLIRELRKKGFQIISIPGPSAITAALSISGFPADEFLFLGFPPPKKGRKFFFTSVSDATMTVVLFESPHRIQKTLQELALKLGEEKEISVIKEITKIHEQVSSGRVHDVIQELDTIQEYRGEYVIVVGPRRRN